MTLDTRPGSLDLYVRPGNAVTLTLDWTASPLAGRTFTVAVSGVLGAITPTIVSNSMTVVFSSTVTTALAGVSKTAWTLTETTSGTQVRITGFLRLSTAGTTSQSDSVTVSVDDTDITVSLVGDAATLAALVTTEAAARASADTTLQTNITAEATARAAADTTEATARASADLLLIPLTQKGAASGVATLGSDGLVPSAQMPAIAISEYLGAAANQSAMLAFSGQRGDWCTRTDTSTTWIVIAEPSSVLANWKQLSTPTDLVLSVNGQAGTVVLGYADVGADASGAAATAQTAAIAAAATDATTKANAKVADAINDGTTTVAPSQNAVFDALALKQPLNLAVNAQTGTTYTFVLGDGQGAMVTLSNAAAITATIPPNSSVAYPVGAQINMAQIGAGQVTVAAGAGVTIRSTPGLKARAQYSALTAIQTVTDTWILMGDLSA